MDFLSLFEWHLYSGYEGEVIVIFPKERSNIADIRRIRRNVYAEALIDEINVQIWVKNFQEIENSVEGHRHISMVCTKEILQRKCYGGASDETNIFAGNAHGKPGSNFEQDYSYFL